MNLSSFVRKIGLAIASLLFIVGSLFITASPAAANTVIVKMGSDSGELVYVPKVVTIKVGDTVKWVNNKNMPHNVIVIDQPELSHKALALKPKVELEATFTEAGEFPYYCSPHRGAGMVGKVIVEG